MKAGKAIRASELSEAEDVDHPYLCYGGNGVRGYIGKSNCCGDYPIIGRQGGTLWKHSVCKGGFLCYGACCHGRIKRLL